MYSFTVYCYFNGSLRVMVKVMGEGQEKEEEMGEYLVSMENFGQILQSFCPTSPQV